MCLEASVGYSPYYLKQPYLLLYVSLIIYKPVSIWLLLDFGALNLKNSLWWHMMTANLFLIGKENNVFVLFDKSNI